MKDRHAFRIPLAYQRKRPAMTPHEDTLSPLPDAEAARPGQLKARPRRPAEEGQPGVDEPDTPSRCCRSCRCAIRCCSRTCSCRCRSAGRTPLAAVEAALATEEKTFIVVAQKAGEQDQPGFDDLYTVGTRAVVKKMARNENGIELIVQGVERVRLLGSSRPSRTSRSASSRYPLPEDAGTEVEALHRRHGGTGAARCSSWPRCRRRSTSQQLVGPGPGPAAPRLPARLDAQPGRGQGAGPAGGDHARSRR